MGFCRSLGQTLQCLPGSCGVLQEPFDALILRLVWASSWSPKGRHIPVNISNMLCSLWASPARLLLSPSDFLQYPSGWKDQTFLLLFLPIRTLLSLILFLWLPALWPTWWQMSAGKGKIGLRIRGSELWVISQSILQHMWRTWYITWYKCLRNMFYYLITRIMKQTHPIIELKPTWRLCVIYFKYYSTKDLAVLLALTPLLAQWHDCDLENMPFSWDT